MPGERIQDAEYRAAAEVKPQGITTILTRLGENLESAAEFEEVTRTISDPVLDCIAAAGLDAHISVKSRRSSGRFLDPALCERNLARLVAHADERGTFVGIDMESSVCRPDDCAFPPDAGADDAVGIALGGVLVRTETVTSRRSSRSGPRSAS